MKQRRAQPLILMVDEDPEACDLYRASFAYEGFRCIQASHADALDCARTRQPDLIIMDAVMLPEHSGDVVQRLKHEPATRGIPILIVSEHALDEHRANAARAGAGGFFAKPAQPGQLAKEIRRLLARSREGRPPAEKHADAQTLDP
jgi:DNA-binding response OmpR family regulator